MGDKKLAEIDESRSVEDGDVEDRAAGMGEDTETVRVVWRVGLELK